MKLLELPVTMTAVLRNLHISAKRLETRLQWLHIKKKRDVSEKRLGLPFTTTAASGIFRQRRPMADNDKSEGLWITQNIYSYRLPN